MHCVLFGVLTSIRLDIAVSTNTYNDIDLDVIRTTRSRHIAESFVCPFLFELMLTKSCVAKSLRFYGP